MIEPLLIENHSFNDKRGSFVKLFDEAKYDFIIRQTNCVKSVEKATFRGIHAQRKPYRESKVFSVITGSIQLICINLDHNILSEYQVFSFMLENIKQSVWVPKGYATGYLTLEEETTVLYFSDEGYQPTQEEGIAWDDPLLQIEFLTQPQHISEKDRLWPHQ